MEILFIKVNYKSRCLFSCRNHGLYSKLSCFQKYVRLFIGPINIITFSPWGTLGISLYVNTVMIILKLLQMTFAEYILTIPFERAMIAN